MHKMKLAADSQSDGSKGCSFCGALINLHMEYCRSCKIIRHANQKPRIQSIKKIHERSELSDITPKKSRRLYVLDSPCDTDNEFSLSHSADSDLSDHESPFFRDEKNIHTRRNNTKSNRNNESGLDLLLMALSETDSKFNEEPIREKNEMSLESWSALKNDSKEELTDSHESCSLTCPQSPNPSVHSHFSCQSSRTVEEDLDEDCTPRTSKYLPALSDSERWTLMFQALKDYGEEMSTCNVPNSYECDARNGMSVKLGTWLSTQRQLKRKDNLRPEREAQLQELVDKGMLCWAMPSIAFPDDEKWTMMYNALVQFGTTYGHCNVPYSHESTLEDGTTAKLGAWLRKQREQKKKGILRPDRNARLQELVDAHMLRLPCSHFTDDSHWMHMLEMLEDYGAKHSHCNVPTVYEAMGDDGQPVRLGLWVRKQRELKKKCSLRPERVKALQELVDRNMFQWEAPNYSPSEDDKWNKMLEILVRYCQQYGHCNVSSAHETVSATGNTIKLGAWLSQQRHHHKKGKLRADREAKLQVLVDDGKLNWGMRCEAIRHGSE